MDWVFWSGIVIGAALSFAASLVANICTDRLQQYLLRYKTSYSDKKRNKALKFYAHILPLTKGYQDKYIFLVLSAKNVIILYLISIMGAVMAMFVRISPLLDSYDGPVIQSALEFPSSGRKYLVLASALLSLFSFLLAGFVNRRTRRIARALMNFDEYEKDLMQRWQFTESEIEEAVRRSSGEKGIALEA
ncbi:MAG: hypothetical protein JSR72_15030 [Proteobacteria bacterium]|nr:hypothetical protein [Pseudomonadota bacterium]